MLRATDHKLPQQKPLDAVHGEVLAAWKKQRGVELAQAAAADAVKRLTAGESWDAVLKSVSANAAAAPTAPKFISRADQDVPLEIRTSAFGEPKPQAKPVYGTARLASRCRRDGVERRAREPVISAAGYGHAPAIRRANRLHRGTELRPVRGPMPR